MKSVTRIVWQESNMFRLLPYLSIQQGRRSELKKNRDDQLAVSILFFDALVIATFGDGQDPNRKS